jgi:DNA-binding transcriptional ArsR family regulator/uncharacterized protein YndB with AHSA1/START domain
MSATEAAVWKALASPLRRRLLDLLRQRPRTTGELAAAFPRLSRFAVMQHLGVLTRSRLVLARRQGRQRFNHLNPVPLQQIHQRWVSRYAEPLAASVLDLKCHAEQPTEGEDPMATKTATGRRGSNAAHTFNVVDVELEVSIAAPPQRVWQALVEQTTAWWRKDFYVGKSPKAFIIEPRLAGGMYEDWGDGAGLLWMSVIEIHPPHTIHFAGHLTTPFGGPANTYLRLTLEPHDNEATILKISNTAYGRVNDKLKQQLHDGWTLLFAEGLKPFVEAGRPALDE